MVRRFGRHYVIQWDSEVRRYHVMLGKDSIGYHQTPEGAKALAASHAGQVTLAAAMQPLDVQFHVAD